MTGISVGTKVHVETGGRSLPGVIVSREFASSGMYDLYTLRIAEYSHSDTKVAGVRVWAGAIAQIDPKADACTGTGPR